MDITEEIRMEYYHAAPPAIQFLYADKKSGAALREIFNYHKLDADLYASFAITVGDVVLGLYEKVDLTAILVQELGISEDTAQGLSKSLTHFLAQVPDAQSLPEADSTLKESLELRPGTSDVIPRGEASVAETQEESTPRPLTRDELLSALSAKRTMASDIQAVQSTDPDADGPMQGYEAYRAQVTKE